MTDVMTEQYADEYDGLGYFLAAQDYAKVQLEESDNEKDKGYWQGVKDGLRKCYAIFQNDPKWAVICRATQERPPAAYDRWKLE